MTEQKPADRRLRISIEFGGHVVLVVLIIAVAAIAIADTLSR
ncbi:hypothetical protein [Agromyces humi]|nr:hypothetical protein [Agromyces humi]